MSVYRLWDIRNALHLTVYISLSKLGILALFSAYDHPPPVLPRLQVSSVCLFRFQNVSGMTIRENVKCSHFGSR